MNRLNEHNLINKLVDVEKITRGLVYNAILSLDNPGLFPPNTRIVIVGGKCFDIAYNKNFLEFLNHQHNLNKENPILSAQMNKILQNNDVSKFLTSSDIDVHMVSQNSMTNANFGVLCQQIGQQINNQITGNNLDYFNSVVKSMGVKIVQTGNRIVNVVKPLIKKLQFIKLNRMYIEFEFIDTADRAILQQLEVIDPTYLTNVRIMSDSRVRLYIFDIVFEQENQNIDGVLDCSVPDFVLNRSVSLPGYRHFNTLSMYDMLSQIYGLIKARANKLARNIVRFAMGILFLRNHYLSPTGLKMCLNDFHKLNTLFIEMIRNKHLNKILNMSTFNILVKGGYLHPPVAVPPPDLLFVDPSVFIYANDYSKIISRFKVKPYRCTTCGPNIKLYKEMIYNKFDLNFKCCPNETSVVNRQHLYVHNLVDLPDENINIFDYYGANFPNGPNPAHNVYQLISNRKNPILHDSNINGRDNYDRLRDRFLQVNIIKYNTFYRYNIAEDPVQVVVKNIRLPIDLVNVCSKKTIITYLPTFLFVENSIINENLFQTYESRDFDTKQANSTRANMFPRLSTDFQTQSIRNLLDRSDGLIQDYVGADSAAYNNKCKYLFISNTNIAAVGPTTNTTNVNDLQKRLIIGSRYNRSEFPRIHNCHNSFMVCSGQYLPITRVKNNQTDKYNNAVSIDDLVVGSELQFNTFNSTSCRLELSYGWRGTDVCYLIRTNYNNQLNENAILSIVQSGIGREMEIVFGYGNLFTLIDKFFNHGIRNGLLNDINLNDEHGTVGAQTQNQLFTFANRVFNNMTKEKKMPVLDTNGSYLNNDISKTYSSQIIAFQAYLNNFDPNIGVSKQMPMIKFDAYNDAEVVEPILNAVVAPNRILASCTDHKLRTLYLKFTGNGNLHNPQPNTWAHTLNAQALLNQNYYLRQLKMNKYLDADLVNPVYTNTIIRNYMNLASNENIITLVLSEATRKRILYSFPQLIDFFYTKNINCSQNVVLPDRANVANSNNLDIINTTMMFKFYGDITFPGAGLAVPNFTPVSDFYSLNINVPSIKHLSAAGGDKNYNSILTDDLELAIYGLRYSVYNAYRLFGFAHGDIINGRNYNLMMDIEKVDPRIEYVMFKTRIGNLIYRYIHKLSKPGFVPKILIIDFGFTDFNYNGHQILTKIANDNNNLIRGSLVKIMADIFTEVVPEPPNQFCLNKLLNLRPFNVVPHLLTAADIPFDADMNKLITSTMINMPNGISLPPEALKPHIKMSVDNHNASDRMVFSRLFTDTWDLNKMMIFSNMDGANNILHNDANVINPEFDRMIQNIIQNKI
jgi:hypothetical protein